MTGPKYMGENVAEFSNGILLDEYARCTYALRSYEEWVEDIDAHSVYVDAIRDEIVAMGAYVDAIRDEIVARMRRGQND
jgi:hypothetical protein